MPVVTQQARSWAASGAMALTGRTDGPPLVAPDGIVDRIRALGAPLDLDPLPLLGERAAIAGLQRQGDVSCGGSSRLLRALDGWVAVSLPRENDVEAVPAWLELDPGDVDRDDPWPAVAETVARRPSSDVVDRGVLLDLPVAVVAHRPSAAADVPPVRARRADSGPVGHDVDRRSFERKRLLDDHVGSRNVHPLVVDLSSLWAGPLCARLMGERGARVVKVESVRRPDGARSGPAGFFDLLHHGHEMVALDLTEPGGVAQLRGLLAAADVVIESSRPRALEQLGIDAVEVLQSGGGGRGGPKVWVSITGHGREGPGRNRVAFGDDAAAAGGLVAHDTAGPCFVADAVADPLSGIAAAAAAVEALDADGRWLLDVAMVQVAAYVSAGAAAGETWTTS